MNDAHPMPVVKLTGLTRSFEQGGIRIDVLRGIDLAIQPGEIVGLLGPSGSGKSTMLQAVGLLEGGFGGRIEIAGTAASELSSGQRTELRRNHLGFVYQFHHLLPDFTAQENVILPQLIAGVDRAAAVERASELLGALGLAERLTHRPSQLSGGEQQRVAIARALANGPRLLLADEPTGNLDDETTMQVLGLLGEVHAETGCTLIVGPGTVDALEAGRTAVAPGGTIVVFTPTPPDVRWSLPVHDLFFNETTIVPSYSAGPDDTGEALRLLVAGLAVEPLITHRLPLSRAAEGYDLIRATGSALKVVVRPETESG